jgi:hypothetical protein
MAIYQYTAPDGNKYRVNAPEGATDQQVYGLVLQNFPYAGQTTKELEETKLKENPSYESAIIFKAKYKD